MKTDVSFHDVRNDRPGGLVVCEVMGQESQSATITLWLTVLIW